MNLVFRYNLFNSLDVPVGPFDLNDIFGPFLRQENFITIPPNSSVEVLCDNKTFHNEGIHERFSSRLNQLEIAMPGVYLYCEPEKAESKPKPTSTTVEAEQDPSAPPPIFSPSFGAPAQVVSMSQPAGTLPSDAQS